MATPEQIEEARKLLLSHAGMIKGSFEPLTVKQKDEILKELLDELNTHKLKYEITIQASSVIEADRVIKELLREAISKGLIFDFDGYL